MIKLKLKYQSPEFDFIAVYSEDIITTSGKKNDVDEDMISSRLGFDTYLVTDCLINRYNKELTLFRNGSFGELFDFIQDSYKQK